MGDHHSIDDKGLTTVIIIIPSCLIFAVISFITGFVLSIKRKQREDLDYNLKPLFWVVHVLIVILVLIFFYNSIVSKIALITRNENVCSLSIKVSYPHSKYSYRGSYMFNPLSEVSCLTDVGIKKADENICKKVCDSFEPPEEWNYCNMNYKDRCYNWVAVEKEDGNICLMASEDIGPDFDWKFCVNFIAEVKGNFNVCELLASEEGFYSRDNCIKHVVINSWNGGTRDINTCNLIKDEEIRKSCISFDNFNSKYFVD